MVSFNYRSSQPELMDKEDIAPQLLYKNLGELDVLNRYLHGHAVSLEGIKQLIVDKQKMYHIVDLGCGSGDVLKYIARWARHNAFQVQLTGVDKNADAIDYLQMNCSAYPEIKGVTSDYKDYLKSVPNVDIIHCALFCHHLNDEQLLELFTSVKSTASHGLVINDLQRNPVAYYCAWIMTRLLNGTTLSKHDGPVSVLRAFTRPELQKLLIEAGIRVFSIQTRWAFRYLVVAQTNDHGN